MLDKPPKTSLGSKFADAVTYALELHRAQYRKTTTVPYAAHLLGVSSIALEFGATEDEAIAAARAARNAASRAAWSRASGPPARKLRRNA